MSAPATQKPAQRPPPVPNIAAPQLNPASGAKINTPAPDWYETYATEQRKGMPAQSDRDRYSLYIHFLH